MEDYRDYRGYIVKYYIDGEYTGQHFNKVLVLARDMTEAIKQCQSIYGQKRYLAKIHFQIEGIDDLGYPEGLHLFENK